MKKMILCLLLTTLSMVKGQAATTYGAELISYQKFGEGLMVVSAKILPLSGTVSNIFFFNREDEPWNGNKWYEYDWEIRGKSPTSGWSQIRVREYGGGPLIDAPKDVSATSKLNKKYYKYILIRRGNTFVYDIRQQFDPETYDHTNPAAHGGNTESMLTEGSRIYQAGIDVPEIPTDKKLDFNLGITGFNNGWAGALPDEPFSRHFRVKYARFYEFKYNNGFELNDQPFWSDEFNGDSLDYSKWQVASWYSGNTQFTPNNVSVSSGKLYLKINRD